MKKLYIIPTPIGNLKDITIRGKELLLEVNSLICEDTRVTKRLLNLLKIEYKEKKFLSYHDSNIKKINTAIDEILKNDKTILVSDTGTPIINDPGFNIVKIIRENYSDQVQIEVLPGPNAVITALVNSGLPADKFTFLGFFPHKKGKTKLLKSLLELNAILNTTFIAFESPYRIIKTLKKMIEIYDDNVTVSICREMTKKFESIVTGTPIELIKKAENGELKIKGEFVVVFKLI